MTGKDFRRRIGRAVALAAAPILLAGLMLAALGAGPEDAPRASNVSGVWVFEGNAFADSRPVPEGATLVACMGDCDEGYKSAPVIIGEDGHYQSLRVAPGLADSSGLPGSKTITFWLVDLMDDRAPVKAVQTWIFSDDGEEKQLFLTFSEVPNFYPSAPSGPSQGVTTDLTIPSASTLGLTPNRSFQSSLNVWRVGNTPVLPGLIIILGLALVGTGASVLIYHRRLV